MKLLCVCWRRGSTPNRRPEATSSSSGTWSGRDGDDGRPIVQPSSALLSRAEPATLLSKLQYLVALNGAASFERLQVLRSQFWSFVEVH